MSPFALLRSFFAAPQEEADGERASINPELTGSYLHNLISANEQPAASQPISDATTADLDLNAVFAALDRTTSRVGQQWLYAQLRLPESEERVAQFIRRTDLFTEDAPLAARCRQALKPLDDDEAYDLQTLIFTTPQPIRHIGAIYALATATALSLTASFIHPLFLLLFSVLFSINAYLHYSNKLRITLYLNSITQLRKSIRAARQLIVEPTIASNYDPLPLADIAALERKCRIIGWQGGSGNDLAALFWLVMEWVKIIFNVEIILLHRFEEMLTQKRHLINIVFRFVGEVDSAISVATLRRERSTCRPRFIAQKRFEITAGVHPLIDTCIPNSLLLDGQSLLLTGSNMSGKTTFIRTLALNALIGQTLGVCFAERYEAPFLRIHSSIRIADDIQAGESYYLAEVLTVKDFITAAADTAPCLFLLDELFKGTNTTERIAAGRAVLAHLNASGNIVCAATHDAELCELLDDTYALYHFREEVRDNDLMFDYKIHEGRLTTRNAIRILELYNYPSEVVEDAYRTQERLIASPPQHYES